MPSFVNALGLNEFVALDDRGQLINKWEQPLTPALSGWNRPLGDMMFTGLGEFTPVTAPDGTRQIWGWGTAAYQYGMAHMTIIVRPDGRGGQTWEAHQTDDLRAFLAKS
jgi:hypothetical protein